MEDAIIPCLPPMRSQRAADFTTLYRSPCMTCHSKPSIDPTDASLRSRPTTASSRRHRASRIASRAGVALSFGVVMSLAMTASHAAVSPQRLTVPAGFQVELLTDAVPNARAMTLGRHADGKGVVYVGSTGAGNLYAVEIAGGRASRVHLLASNLDIPAGVAYKGGALYAAGLSRIVRFDGIDDRLDNPPKPVLVTDKLPSESHHGVKTIGFGPDDKLYVSIGSPCNVCVDDAAHGVIRRMNADGSGMETVASGIRNSVGFDWSPVDRALWFSDNGRDMMGDDVPGDELNRAQQAGQNFGFPYCHQGDVADPQYGSQHPCSDFVKPAAVFGAHVAALGMRFYRADAVATGGAPFPADFRQSIFIAQHGSWNRSKKSGYQVVRAVVDAQGRVVRVEPFVTGFLAVDASGRESVLGRPADVLMLPDGSLLISDDQGGAIYRVSYRGAASVGLAPSHMEHAVSHSTLATTGPRLSTAGFVPISVTANSSTEQLDKATTP
ncbi:MAG: sorbosone dehydrogenase [Rhizobacter sp.]|nr:sorbosone dehydrogenase [Rhizobacter sp.]